MSESTENNREAMFSPRNSDAEDVPAARFWRETLDAWETPAPSPALDRRMLASFRQVMTEKDLFADVPHSAATYPALAAQEVRMKKCPHCTEEFADKFSFCPVDGTPLNALAAALVATPAPVVGENSVTHAAPLVVASVPVVRYTRPEYHLTVLEEAGLTQRLAREVRALKQSWPDFKRDPVGFTRQTFAAAGARLAAAARSPYTAMATFAALAIVFGAIITIILADRHRTNQAALAQNQELELMQMVEPEIPKEEEKPVKEGNAGNNKGKGGGSLVKPAKPQGGGGGGDEKADKPVSKGEPPPMSQEPQIVVPKPQPPPPRPVLLPVMPTLKGDAALSRTPRNMQFGDEDSNATEISRGKGTGEGFGGGDGTGAGKGSGAGLGPGRGENTGGGDGKYGGGGTGGGGGGKPPAPEIDYNRPFTAKEVTRKAVITGKPEPPYTEEGRKNATVGTVVIRVLLGANGSVQQASAVTRLPYGLTESAVAAARRIRFTPAQKDGRNVSQWVQVEYSFNLY